MTTFSITRKLDLPNDKVWAIISNFNRPPSPAIKIEIEDEGNPNANGIGAIININIKGAKARERLEAVDPPNSITYRMLSGAPVKEYSGRVNVADQNGKSLINWDVYLISKIPGMGWIISSVIKRAINHYIDAIEEGRQ